MCLSKPSFWLFQLETVWIFWWHIKISKIKSHKLSSIFLSLVFQDISQLFEQFIEVFGDEVCTLGVILGHIISFLPLMNEEVIISVIESSVMIIDPTAYFQISEANTSGKPSQIFNSSIVSSEEVKYLFSLGVSNVENFLPLNPGVVWSVGDRSGVVRRIELSEAKHMIRQIKFISRYFQSSAFTDRTLKKNPFKKANYGGLNLR